METKVQIYQYLCFAFCYVCPWNYSSFFCAAAFGEHGDEGDADGVQLPEPELDGVQAASTNGVDADGVQLPEPEADGVQASGMVIQSASVCCRTAYSTCWSL